MNMPDPQYEFGDDSDGLEFMPIIGHTMKRFALGAIVLAIAFGILVAFLSIWKSAGIITVAMLIWISYKAYNTYEEQIPAPLKIVAMLAIGGVASLAVLAGIIWLIVYHGYWFFLISATILAATIGGCLWGLADKRKGHHEPL